MKPKCLEGGVLFFPLSQIQKSASCGDIFHNNQPNLNTNDSVARAIWARSASLCNLLLTLDRTRTGLGGAYQRVNCVNLGCSPSQLSLCALYMLWEEKQDSVLCENLQIHIYLLGFDEFFRHRRIPWYIAGLYQSSGFIHYEKWTSLEKLCFQEGHYIM